MHTWWKAVCDEHRETCVIFVNSIARTAELLADDDDIITAWMSEHWGCKLRLIHMDADLDACAGYKHVRGI